MFVSMYVLVCFKAICMPLISVAPVCFVVQLFSAAMCVSSVLLNSCHPHVTHVGVFVMEIVLTQLANVTPGTGYL